MLDFLEKRYRFKERAQWSQVVGEEKVLVNGIPGELTTILSLSDEVVYEAPESPEPAVDENFSVLFEDEYLIALNKSGNLPCHPSGCYHDNTLWYLIKEGMKLTRPHLINRLDRESSGVVLVAKSDSTARNLSKQFLKRRVKKSYAVIVEGDFPETLDAFGWLMADKSSAVRKKRRFERGLPEEKPDDCAEWAETRFELKQRCGALTLVHVELMTGRLHQIRATLCSLGFPVVGDKLYGVDENLFIRFINDQLSAADKAALRMSRQALHARELQVAHPATGEPLRFCAPLPDDMRPFIQGAFVNNCNRA